MKDKIRIAVQNNGRLKEPSLEFLRSAGLIFGENGRNLIVPCSDGKTEILYVRNKDIPAYLKGNVADFGIVGENVVYEKREKFEIVRKLGFGKCELVIAVPIKSKFQSIRDLEGERIATSYPNLLKSYLKNNGVTASVIYIAGSVEIAPLLNLADAICDITQTGKTLEENGLRPIETVIKSEAVLIKCPNNEKVFL